MRLEQNSRLLPNSAAIPLPTPPNSAAGGDAQLVDKYLKEQEFFEKRRPFAGTEARFLPAVREMLAEFSDARRMRGERPLFFTNRKTGDGVDRIVDFHRLRGRAAHLLKIRRWRDFGSRINPWERKSPRQ
jgi:hypothetical protein